jgi:hypothetical protein
MLVHSRCDSGAGVCLFPHTLGRVLPSSAPCRSYRHRLLFRAYLPFAAPRSADRLVADRRRQRPRSASCSTVSGTASIAVGQRWGVSCGARSHAQRRAGGRVLANERGRQAALGQCDEQQHNLRRSAGAPQAWNKRYFSFSSCVTWPPRISRTFSRSTAPLLAASIEPKVLARIGSTLSRKPSNAAQLR